MQTHFWCRGFKFTHMCKTTPLSKENTLRTFKSPLLQNHKANFNLIWHKAFFGFVQVYTLTILDMQDLS